MMENLIGDILKGAETADKFIETSEEAQATATERLKIDMTSDNWLSKSIRPITLIVLMALQILIVFFSAFNHSIDPALLAQHGTLLLAAFSFYFHSKKVERVADKNALANLKIEEMKLKHAQKMERKESRK